MPNKPFDDKKHPRDTGKFTKIPGGKDPSGAGDAPPEEVSPQDQIRQQVMSGVGGEPMRDPNKLHAIGFHTMMGYNAARKALDALHAGGIQNLQHHGRAIQQAIKLMKHEGAKPEELTKAREGLADLHGALSTQDPVKAHEAVVKLQHGFYHAHTAVRKEHGGGSFPLIGQEYKDAITKDFVQGAINKRMNEKSGMPPASQHNEIQQAQEADRKQREAFIAEYKSRAKFSADKPHLAPLNSDHAHHRTLVEHGYKYVGEKNGGHIYEHPSGSMARHTRLYGTTVMHPGHTRGSYGPEHVKALGEHLSEMHKSSGKFSDLDSLPAKPTPEDFDKAVKMCGNVKIKAWDHRYIDMERLHPSEIKEPDNGLVDSIKKDPTKTPPIVVKPDGDRYNILDGHHRYFATQKAGHKGMWAVVVKDGEYMRDNPTPPVPSQQPIQLTINMPKQPDVTVNQAPITMKAGADAEEFRDIVKEMRREPVHVHVEAAPASVTNKVEVNPTPVKFEAKVEVPQSAAPAVNVHVNPTPVHIDNKVEARPGEVKVNVDLKPAPKAEKSIAFTTDDKGKLTGAKVTEK